ELGRTARGKTPQEQQQVSLELVKEIQQEGDPIMRRHLLRTLAEFPTEPALAMLKAGCHDSEAEVRIVACRMLGKRGGSEAVQELQRVVTSDTSGDVRVAAVRALGETHDAASMPALAEALVDGDPAMQFRAKESLRTVSGRDFGDNTAAWRQYAKTGQTEAP